uniref:GG11296 n=1 Tax=Drosophila erecta TaxID=7220 RepID=B3P728_DROER
MPSSSAQLVSGVDLVPRKPLLLLLLMMMEMKMGPQMEAVDQEEDSAVELRM